MTDPGTNSVDPQGNPSTPPTETPRNPDLVPQAPPSVTHNAERTYSNPDPTPLWKIILEAGAIAVGIIVAWIYYGQLDQMIKSNRIAKDAYQSGQRAYIVYEDMIHTMDVVTNPRGKDTIVFSIATKWQNTGNTPAVGAISVVAANEQEEEITEQEFVGSVPEVIVRQPVSAIGPKIPFTSVFMHLPESFADSVEKPRYIWGWVLYRDIFPDTKPHVTEFCYRVTKIEKIDIINYSFEKIRPCTHHNCIDEFCDDYANLAALTPNN